MVGLTAYLERVQTGIWDIPAGYLPADYFEGITRAGGIAVLLPPQPVDTGIVGSLLDGLHALVITGGYDLDPAGYGQRPHPSTDAPRTDRDAWEFALLRGALQRGLPVLGICRGALRQRGARPGRAAGTPPDASGPVGVAPGGSRHRHALLHALQPARAVLRHRQLRVDVAAGNPAPHPGVRPVADHP
ncbi:gamma-glutamyl-gamma-aminobutyrate hydrolase family protein, partial [Mycobacterium avium]|uniref:gamma-glutamyl-gamma-aminobutyrate hydrolase family protein n=1 Tax=Mycobacterium avium TaxID=1764 RepID=UPI00373FDD15